MPLDPNLPFLAFMCNPLIKDAQESVWVASLTPDGKIINNGFTSVKWLYSISPEGKKDNVKLKLNDDQIALVQYDEKENEGIRLKVVATWTIRPSWLLRWPFFARFKMITSRILKRAYAKNEIFKILDGLWQAAKESDFTLEEA